MHTVPTRSKLYLKWSVLVVLSSILSLCLGMLVENHWAFILGMCAGILCFIFIYTKIDYYLAQHDKTVWRKALLIGVCIKMVMQVLVPQVEMLCGEGALKVTELILNTPDADNVILYSFIFSWIATIITGTLLSLVVGILTLFSKWILFLLSQPRA